MPWQSLVPRMDAKNVVASGCLRARSSSYSASAATVVGCSGRIRSQRDLAGRTGSSPASRSMPPDGIARASPMRTPVTAISPNRAV